MSKRTRLSQIKGLNRKLIIDAMYANGCRKEDVDELLENGTLADVEAYIDIDSLFDF